MIPLNSGDEITIWCEGHLPEYVPEPPNKSGCKESEEMPPTKKCDLIDQPLQILFWWLFKQPDSRLKFRAIVDIVMGKQN